MRDPSLGDTYRRILVVTDHHRGEQTHALVESRARMVGALLGHRMLNYLEDADLVVLERPGFGGTIVKDRYYGTPEWVRTSTVTRFKRSRSAMRVEIGMRVGPTLVIGDDWAAR